MPGNRDGERSAVELLATSFTIVAGVLICTFLITGFSRQTGRDFAIMFAWFAGIILLLFLLRDKRETGEGGFLSLWFASRKTEEFDLRNYTLRRRRRRRKTERETMPLSEEDDASEPSGETPPGENRPPTVESVREAKKSSLNTWVPANSSGRPDRQ